MHQNAPEGDDSTQNYTLEALPYCRDTTAPISSEAWVRMMAAKATGRNLWVLLTQDGKVAERKEAKKAKAKAKDKCTQGGCAATVRLMLLGLLFLNGLSSARAVEKQGISAKIDLIRESLRS